MTRNRHPTARQQQFCRNLLSGEYGSNRAAAIAAGYPPGTASAGAQRALKAPHVQAYIEYLKSGKPGQNDALTADQSDKAGSIDEQLKAVKLELEQLKLERARAEDSAESQADLADAWATHIRLAYSHGVAECARLGQHEADRLTDSAPARIEQQIVQG